MHTLLATISLSVLGVCVRASPLAQAPVQPPTDACGPKAASPGDPTDSCFTKPASVDTASAFGIIGSTDGSFRQSYDWSVCDPVLTQICDQMFATNFTTNAVRIVSFLLDPYTE